MSHLLKQNTKPTNSTSPIVQVTPEDAAWTYIGFEVFRLTAGDKISFDCQNRETAVIVLEGTCDVTVDKQQFEAVGGRNSVFDDVSPEVIYSPPDHQLQITATTKAEVAIATAVSKTGVGEVRRISSADIPFEERGEGATKRYIRHLLDEHHPAAKLLLVEVITPAGNWSSFPPHKHDEESPTEAYLEETYYYRLNPGHGQALQRVYNKQDLNEVLTPKDGDVVLVPEGYHPVAAPPGFKTYYLNVMAGHNRVWKYQVDEDYAHITPKGGNIMGNVKHS
jgi:5-deoxy-glucuronate isomerase